MKGGEKRRKVKKKRNKEYIEVLRVERTTGGNIGEGRKRKVEKSKEKRKKERKRIPLNLKRVVQREEREVWDKYRRGRENKNKKRKRKKDE